MPTQDLTQPADPASQRISSRRIAEGVSQPPWPRRAAIVAVLISLPGADLLPEGLNWIWTGRWNTGNFIWPSLIGALPLLCCLGYLTRKAGTTIETVFGLRGVCVRKAVVSGILLLMLELLLAAATWIALESLGCDGPDVAGRREEARAITSSFFLFTDVTVWAPLCEELAYRGLLYTSLRTRFGVIPSAVITAALFGFTHPLESFAHGASLFVPAILSSLWYERTRSLYPNVLAHALNNIFVNVG